MRWLLVASIESVNALTDSNAVWSICIITHIIISSSMLPLSHNNYLEIARSNICELIMQCWERGAIIEWQKKTIIIIFLLINVGSCCQQEGLAASRKQLKSFFPAIEPIWSRIRPIGYDLKEWWKIRGLLLKILIKLIIVKILLTAILHTKCRGHLSDGPSFLAYKLTLHIPDNGY